MNQHNERSANTPRQFDPSMFTQAIDRVVGEYRAAWRKGESHSLGIVEQAEQYARLIAAAPMLLDMLKSCVAYFDNMKHGGFGEACPDPEWLAPVRAAIRAAKGE